MRRAIILLFGVLNLSLLTAQSTRPTPFQPDSALAVLRTLAEEIGPRPMGSPAERRALEYAVGKFREFGLHEASILEFTQTPPDRSGSRTNTRSGTAVGVLRGTTSRRIVIGAHIDSASPEIQGANDDGSGSAVVIELARVMAQRQWSSTIVFCLFGGEESGLRGSRDFVERYPLLDSVAVMLQVDMANGSPWLLPMYDVGAFQAPRWLVNAAYEEISELGHSGLYYPVHFYTLNTALGGGASSDHQPFLEKGVPAIDFTTDVSDPIHTQQDSYRWFRPGGLERSGDLVFRMVERFDGGVPEPKTEQYLTVQLGSIPLFFPRWSLFLIVLIAALAGIIALVRLRPTRTEVWKSPRPTIPGLKVYGGVLLIALAGWLSEDLFSYLKGWRASWYSNPSLMIAPGFMIALIATLAVAAWSRRWNLSNDPYRYALRTVATFAVFIALASLASLRLALYPATGLLLCSMAFLVRPLWLKGVLVFAGAYPTSRLLFSETFDFIASAFALIPAEPAWSAIAVTGGLALFSSVLILPYAYALTGILRHPDTVIPAGRPVRFALRALGIIAGFVFLWVLREPAYTDYRARALHISQTVENESDSVSVRVQSNEYVKDAVIRTVDGDTGTVERITSLMLPKQRTDASSWVDASTLTQLPSDTGEGTSMFVNIRTKYRPYTMTIRYEPRNVAVLAADAGLLAVNATRRTASLRWYSFPDTSLMIPLRLALSAPDTVLETIEATFVEQATPVTIIGKSVSTTSRTVVRHERTIIIP